MRVKLDSGKLAEVISQSSLTQNHWAIRMGLSRGHLADLVNGKHPYPSPGTRQKILTALDMEFDSLFAVETPEAQDDTVELETRFKQGLSDRYAIDRELGRGGMGIVYLARDLKHGRQVAIKVVHPDTISHVGTSDFLREIRITAGLQHPNILPLLDSGEENGCPYYITPYVRGGSLRDRLDSRKGRGLSMAEVMPLFKGVASALAEASRARLAHLDMKPENVLLSGDQAVVADFGISRAIHSDGHAWRATTDTSVGTPAYVSPEQASGDIGIDHRSDIYSVACMIHELLAGAPPFDGASDTAAVARRFLSDPPDLSEIVTEVPYRAAQVIKRALSVDPRRRYASVDEFYHAFERAVAGGFTLGERLDDAALTIRRGVARVVPEPVARAVAAPLRMIARPFQPDPSGYTNRFKGSARLVSMILQDLIFTLRTFRKRPLQATILVLTIAIGIGVNTAMFSIVNAVLVRPLPFPEPDRLVRISEGVRGGRDGTNVPWPNFVDMREQLTSFSGVGAYMGGSSPVLGGDQPIIATAYTVTEEYFTVLGVPAAIGSNIAADDGTPVAVLSHEFWSGAFGQDSSVIGRTIGVGRITAEVIGVMPMGVGYPATTDVWVVQNMESFFGPSRTAHNLRVVGRVADGADLSTARLELDRLAASLHEQYPSEIGEDDTFAAVPLHEFVTRNSRSTLTLLFVVVGLVLLIACGNMASILMSQGVGRSKEIAIRRAVGAGQSRLVTQLLTESVLLGFAGSVVAIILTFVSMSWINALVPAGYLHTGAVSVDWRVALFTLALGLATGLLFGLLPAVRSLKYQPVDVLRTDGNQVVAADGTRRRLGGLFVIPQYALSLTALVVAGLVLRSLFNLTSVDPGYPVENRLAVALTLPGGEGSRYSTSEGIVQFHRTLLDRVRAIPGVESATLDNSPSLAPWASRPNGSAYKQFPEDFSESDAYPSWHWVGPEFFGTTGIPLVAGRDFTSSDGPTGPPVAIVSEGLAAQLYPGEDPIGRTVMAPMGFTREESSQVLQIVGVAADVHNESLAEEPNPTLYSPIWFWLSRGRGTDLVVSTSVSPTSVVQQVRQVIREIDPELPVGRIATLDDLAAESVGAPRFRAGLLTSFGAIAVLLAVLGVYGVMSYSVSQRVREMAVRMALGAERSDVYRLLAIEGAKFIVAGQVLGTIAILGMGRLLNDLLFGVSARDLSVYAIVSPIMALVVVVTTLIPARRAGHVDPAIVLRE